METRMLASLAVPELVHRCGSLENFDCGVRWSGWTLSVIELKKPLPRENPPPPLVSLGPHQGLDGKLIQPANDHAADGPLVRLNDSAACSTITTEKLRESRTIQ